MAKCTDGFVVLTKSNDSLTTTVAIPYDYGMSGTVDSFESIAFEAAPIGIVLTENRIIRTCNRKFCVLSGFSRDQLVGQSFRKLLFDDSEYERVRDIGFKA